MTLMEPVILSPTEEDEIELCEIEVKNVHINNEQLLLTDINLNSSFFCFFQCCEIASEKQPEKISSINKPTLYINR